jgi:hypothetical protein
MATFQRRAAILACAWLIQVIFVAVSKKEEQSALVSICLFNRIVTLPFSQDDGGSSLHIASAVGDR